MLACRLVRGEAAIDNEGVADDKACAFAAKPEHRRGYLFGAAETANRLIAQDILHGFGLFRKHHPWPTI